MFKKRIVKKSGEIPITKRKLELSDSDHEPDSILSELKQTSTQSVFKKRIKTSAKAPNKEVVHGEIGSGKDSAEVAPKTSDFPDPIPQKSSVKPLPANIKTITITDFQPDVCKDFLQTGYCGYGDTCKFLHIRDESKQNKPIEKEWQDVGDSRTKEKEQLPFKCVLCKDDYKNPVKTQCGHIYCKTCFLDRYKVKKKPKCFICSKETNGIIVPVSKTELAKLTNM